MTTPISHGYPDWGRTASVSDIEVLVFVDAAFAGSTNFGPFFVGNLPYLSILFFVFLDRGQVALQWAADAAGTLPMGTDTIVSGVSGQASMHVPVGGPWLIVNLQAGTYPASIDLEIFMSAVARVRMGVAGSAPPTLITSVGLAAGAGATVTVDSTRTLPGPAHWSVDTALATWTARLQAADLAGAFTRIATLRNTSLPRPCLVYLPPQPCRISVTNTTAGAGTFDLTLVGQSLSVG